MYQPVTDSWTGVLVMWQHTRFGLGWTVSPLVSFQSPSAEFRLTLKAMAARVPVWRDWTSATVLTPRAAPRATLPSQPLLPRGEEEPVPWLDFQTAAVVVVENFLARRAALIWPRRGLVAGFPPRWGLPEVKMCVNLTPAPLKSARTRDRTGPVHRGALTYENRADICRAMPERHRGG